MTYDTYVWSPSMGYHALPPMRKKVILKIVFDIVTSLPLTSALPFEVFSSMRVRR